MKSIECNENGKDIVACCTGKRIRIFCTRCNHTIRYEDMPVEQELIEESGRVKDIVKSEYKIPFGIHKGKYLQDVPKDYLIWSSKNSSRDVKTSVEIYLKFLDIFV